MKCLQCGSDDIQIPVVGGSFECTHCGALYAPVRLVEVENDEPDILPCPYCGSLDNEYYGEVYDDDHHEGSGYKCMECGSSWTDGRWDELHGDQS